MAKRDGRWVIIVSHTADFNAKAPGSASQERTSAGRLDGAAPLS